MKTRFALLVLFCLSTATYVFGSTAPDTTLSVQEIGRMESIDTEREANAKRLNDIWRKTTYFNIMYNNTKLSSSELLSATGTYSQEFNNAFGVGIQSGHTYKFHKNPLGNVVFFGLDFTWVDLNLNSYNSTESPVLNEDSEDATSKVKYMPWHHKKMTLDFGMSVGPSLTLYPFTSLHNNTADKVRFHTYFHVGYAIAGAMIKDVDESDEYAYGHGLFTSFGLNLTWDFIGLGYEYRNDSNIKYKYASKDFEPEKLKFKQSSSRLYIQFRF